MSTQVIHSGIQVTTTAAGLQLHTQGSATLAQYSRGTGPVTAMKLPFASITEVYTVASLHQPWPTNQLQVQTLKSQQPPPTVQGLG